MLILALCGTFDWGNKRSIQFSRHWYFHILIALEISHFNCTKQIDWINYYVPLRMWNLLPIQSMEENFKIVFVFSPALSLSPRIFNHAIVAFNRVYLLHKYYSPCSNCWHFCVPTITISAEKINECKVNLSPFGTLPASEPDMAI